MPRGSGRAAKRYAAEAALRAGDDDRPVLRPPAGERVEDGHVVRSAGVTQRVYRCPGCDQELVGVAHVVAWPQGRPDDRRHWHSPCWQARAVRGVKVHRSKNAPRYG